VEVAFGAFEHSGPAIDPEGEFAGHLRQAVELFSATSTNRVPTNWADIFPDLHSDYLIKWEQRFMQLPEQKRGFKNSLLEKYAFVDPQAACFGFW
jgi:hypothetical protein